MGVPGFFLWLRDRCPAILQKLAEVQADCLYIDTNGPVHDVSHGDPTDLPKDEDEILERFFEMLDHVVKLVKPKRLLYMALDGVAPRAKMNQQRARRFMAVRESAGRRELEAQVREVLHFEGAERINRGAPGAAQRFSRLA